MNLAELVEQVKTELRNFSSAAAYEAELRNRINEAYIDLVESNTWRFLFRKATLTCYADVEDVAVTVSNGSSTVTFGTSVNRAHWAGMPITITVSDVELETTVAYAPDSTSLTLTISNAWASATDGAGTATVQFNRVPLPRDVRSIDGVVDRTRNRELKMLDPEHDRRYMLDVDDKQGPPVAYLDEPPEVIDRAPRTAPTAADTGTGSLSSSIEYRYLYCYYHEGRVSPRSEIVAHTTATGAIRVTLPNTNTAQLKSRRKWVYRDDGNRQFHYIAEVTASDTTYDDDGTDVPVLEQPYEEHASYRYLRFYPRPTTDTELELHYYCEVERLVVDTDQPQIPRAYHEILAKLAAALVLDTTGGEVTGEALRRTCKDRLGIFRARYGMDRARKPQRPMRGVEPARGTRLRGGGDTTLTRN